MEHREFTEKSIMVEFRDRSFSSKWGGGRANTDKMSLSAFSSIVYTNPVRPSFSAIRCPFLAICDFSVVCQMIGVL
jgi:hypothetical protein